MAALGRDPAKLIVVLVSTRRVLAVAVGTQGAAAAPPSPTGQSMDRPGPL
jgi:hypothetical protein